MDLPYDARSDVFSLGALLYEVTSKAPRPSHVRVTSESRPNRCDQGADRRDSPPASGAAEASAPHARPRRSKLRP